MPNLKLDWKAIAVAVGILVPIACGLIGYGVLRADVTHGEEDRTEIKLTHKDDIDDVKAWLQAVDSTIDRLDVSVGKLTTAFEFHHRMTEAIGRDHILPPPITLAEPATFAADGTDYPLTLSDVSSKVGRTPDTVVRWLSEHKVDVRKRKTPQGEYRFSHEDLAKLLAYATRVHVTEEP